MSSQPTAYVFGSSASALITARLLEVRGYNVELFDSGNHFQKDSPRFIPPDLGAIPATEEMLKSLQAVAQAAHVALDAKTNDLSPLCLADGAFTSFIGFGERKSKSIPALSRLNLNARWALTPKIENLLLDVLVTFQGKIHNFSEVSRVEVSGASIAGIEINGAKVSAADLYVFGLSPRELPNIFSVGLLSNKNWTKLSRSPIWCRLAIEIQLPKTELADNQMVFCLPNAEELEPWAGLPAATPSQWIAYIPEEKSDDPEAIGNEIKSLKKWLAKAFPEINENTREPRIHVTPGAAGSYSWLEHGALLEAELSNALFVSELMSEYDGLAGSLDSACSSMARLVSRENQPVNTNPDQPSILESNSLP